MTGRSASSSRRAIAGLRSPRTRAPPPTLDVRTRARPTRRAVPSVPCQLLTALYDSSFCETKLSAEQIQLASARGCRRVQQQGRPRPPPASHPLPTSRPTSGPLLTCGSPRTRQAKESAAKRSAALAREKEKQREQFACLSNPASMVDWLHTTLSRLGIDEERPAQAWAPLGWGRVASVAARASVRRVCFGVCVACGMHARRVPRVVCRQRAQRGEGRAPMCRMHVPHACAACMCRMHVPHAATDRMVNAMDDDQSGTITLHEFEAGLHGLGIELDKYGPRALFRAIDEDGSDVLSIEEVRLRARWRG